MSNESQLLQKKVQSLYSQHLSYITGIYSRHFAIWVAAEVKFLPPRQLLLYQVPVHQVACHLTLHRTVPHDIIKNFLPRSLSQLVMLFP